MNAGRVCRLGVLLVLLGGCHPSGVSHGLLACFPDSAGTRRTYELTRPQGGSSRLLLETRVADRRLPGRLGLDFLDPLHEPVLGNYQVVVQDTLLELVLPDAGLRFPLMEGPMVPEREWKQPLPGFERQHIGWHSLQAPDGRSVRAFGCRYRISAPLLERIGIPGAETTWELELWLAPGLGPVRILANGNYREERIR